MPFIREKDDPREVRLTLVVIAVALAVLCWAVAASAQPPFPARGVEIVNELYAGVNPQDDNARRVSIHRTCSQLVFELGPRWGNKKRAGLSDDFRSPDSLAYLEDDSAVSVWDIQASSGAILVHAGKPPDYPRLPSSEAAFMPCAPANYLMPQPPPPVVIPPSAPPPVVVPPVPPTVVTCAECPEILERVKGIQDDTQALRSGAARVWKAIGKYILPPLGAGLTAWLAKPDHE